MKSKASILTKLTLGIVIAGSIAACKPSTTETSTTAAPAAATSKTEIVYINQDSLLSKYEFVKDSNKRLKDKGDAASNDVGSREQALQREFADYQKNANTMSADQRAATEQRLQREGQTFQQYKQNAGAQIQNEQLAEQTKLYDKVSDFLKAYAKEKGYKMIFTFQKGNPTLMYGDASLDVTVDVLKRLNDAYAKDKK